MKRKPGRPKGSKNQKIEQPVIEQKQIDWRTARKEVIREIILDMKIDIAGKQKTIQFLEDSLIEGD